jgi:hypothetical protein
VRIVDFCSWILGEVRIEIAFSPRDRVPIVCRASLRRTADWPFRLRKIFSSKYIREKAPRWERRQNQPLLPMSIRNLSLVPISASSEEGIDFPKIGGIIVRQCSELAFMCESLDRAAFSAA